MPTGAPRPHQQPTAAYGRAGLLCNPLSGRIAPRIDRLRRLTGASGLTCREASSLAGINAAVDAFRDEGTDLLVIAGGDGTVQAVLDRLLADILGPPLPRLMIIPGGTTNMTAIDLGVRGGPVANMKRLALLLRRQRTGASVMRHVLRIDRPGQPALHGMFFGAGAIAGAARYFHLKIRRSGVTGEFASLIVILRFLAGFLAGGRNLPPAPIRLNAAGEIREADCLLLFASTLDRLLLGMRPYWGTGDDPVHATYIRTSPRRFWRSLPALVSGHGAGLKAADGYYSRNFNSFEIYLAGEYMVDGEFFHAGGDSGPLGISAAGPVEFVLP